MANYMAMTGLDYNGKRVEAGDLVSDLPTKSVSWLVEQGLIVLATDAPKETALPKGKKADEVAEEKI